MRRIGLHLIVGLVIVLLTIGYISLLPSLVESHREVGRIINVLPHKKVVDGMGVTLNKVTIHEWPSPLFLSLFGWRDYYTRIDWTGDVGGWRLKRVNYTDCGEKPRDFTWPSYFPEPETRLDRALWPANGPYEVVLGFRAVEDGRFPQTTIVEVPGPGKTLSVTYDFTAFDATIHMIGAFGAGASIPGTGQTARSPCLAFSIQGDPQVAFTVMTSQAYLQPVMAINQTDFLGPQTCVQFPLNRASNLFVYAIGPRERAYHFFVNVPKEIEPPVFYTIN